MMIHVDVGQSPPSIQQPSSPPNPGQTRSYGDYLVCVGAEFINQGFGDEDKAFVTVLANVAPFAFAAAGEVPAAYAAAIIGGIYDINLALRIRATCKQEVYGQ